MPTLSQEYIFHPGPMPVRIGQRLRYVSRYDDFAITTYWTVTRLLPDGRVVAIRDVAPPSVVDVEGPPEFLYDSSR
jgi:hypothetical protein